MNVYFDYQIFYLQKYGGISRYFVELNKALNKIADCNAKIIAPVTDNEYIRYSKPSDHVVSFNSIKPLVSNKLFNRSLQANILLSGYLVGKKAGTILHETYYTNRLKASGQKRVITIHDMIPELFLNDSEYGKSLIADKKQAILGADNIIAVSQSTKNDLVKFYPAVAHKIHVVYHGVNKTGGDPIKQFEHPKPFILYVGHRAGYKNFNNLALAFSKNGLSAGYDLICFGGGALDKQELDTLKNLGILGSVKQLTGNDELLNALYRSAVCFVYPSLYEGFGMPVLEAMALKCPVICADNSSLPEVAGDAALLVNGENIDDIYTAINKVLSDTVYKNELIKRGLERVEDFTWETCALNTYKVYSSTINQ